MATLEGTLSFYIQSELWGMVAFIMEGQLEINMLIRGVQVRQLQHFKLTPHFYFAVHPFSR